MTNEEFEDIYNEIIKSEINIHYHSEIRFEQKNNRKILENLNKMILEKGKEINSLKID